MTAALKFDFVSVEDYLAAEKQSQVRHEYVDGQVFAMAGGSQSHNIIAGNLFAALHSRLRGGPCRPFINDLKARISIKERELFYYPDVMVLCDPRDREPYFARYPKIIIEALSETTERLERTEKFWSYMQLESLDQYVLASQQEAQITTFLRSNEWRPEILNGIDQELLIPSLQTSISLREIYEGVEF